MGYNSTIKYSVIKNFLEKVTYDLASKIPVFGFLGAGLVFLGAILEHPPPNPATFVLTFN